MSHAQWVPILKSYTTASVNRIIN